MFGNEPMIGLKKGKIDAKRRLSLQSISGAEENDNVALVFDKTRKYLRVCKVEEINVEYELLKKHIDAEFELMKTAINAKEIIERITSIDEKRKLLNLYAHSLAGIVRVDEQKRIIIPQLAAEELEMQKDIELYIEGAFDHMNIYPNKEVYLEVKKALTNRN